MSKLGAKAIFNTLKAVLSTTFWFEQLLLLVIDRKSCRFLTD